MSQIVLPAGPTNSAALMRFGNGDAHRAKSYLLAFYGFLAAKPKNTARAYRFALKEFFDLWEWRSPETITVAEAAYYKKWLMSQKKGDATICQRLAACKSFFDFLMKPTGASTKQLVTSNPFQLVTRKDVTPTPYGRSRPTDGKHLQLMLRAMPTDALGKRDNAVLVFLAFTGRRRAEVANLRMRDLDLRDPKNRTYRSKVKGGEIQHFALPDVAYEAMREHWISSNRLHDLSPESAVFGAVHVGGSYREYDPHRCLHVNTIAQIVKNAAERAGIDPGEVHVHGIRHLFARDLDEAGLRIQDIQRDLGHKGMNTTAVYVGKLKGPAPSAEEHLNRVRAKAAAEAAAAIA